MRVCASCSNARSGARRAGTRARLRVRPLSRRCTGCSVALPSLLRRPLRVGLLSRALRGPPSLPCEAAPFRQSRRHRRRRSLSAHPPPRRRSLRARAWDSRSITSPRTACGRHRRRAPLPAPRSHCRRASRAQLAPRPNPTPPRLIVDQSPPSRSTPARAFAFGSSGFRCGQRGADGGQLGRPRDKRDGAHLAHSRAAAGVQAYLAGLSGMGRPRLAPTSLGTDRLWWRRADS